MTDLPAAAITAAENPPAEPERCDHLWALHHEPGHHLYWIRQCMVCRHVDWENLDAQIAAELEAAAPHITAAATAAERARIGQGSPHRVETGGEYCQEDGFRWPCRTARWLADLLREDTP